MKGILGTKIGMTQVFEKNGHLIPVTIVHVEPNVVLGLKTKDKDGYVSTVLGYKITKLNRLTKPQQGIFKKNKQDVRKVIREVRNMDGHEIGSVLKIHDLFVNGQWIDVQGVTKGHGYTGAIKRWNFKIGPLGHGAGYKHRYQGSVQTGRGGSQAQRVFKGKKMSGHYGHEICTIQNLSIVKLLPEDNIVLIKGAIPGPAKSMVLIHTAVKNPQKITTFDLVEIKHELKQDLTKEEKSKQQTAPELKSEVKKVELPVVSEPKQESETKQEPKVKVEQMAVSQPEPKQEPAAKLESVVLPKTEPIVELERVIVAEPEPKQEPKVKVEQMAVSQPEPKQEPAVKLESVVLPRTEPIVEVVRVIVAEPEPKQESVVEVQTKQEPVVQTEPMVVFQPEIKQDISIKEPLDPLIESDLYLRPHTEFVPFIESEIPTNNPTSYIPTPHVEPRKVQQVLEDEPDIQLHAIKDAKKISIKKVDPTFVKKKLDETLNRHDTESLLIKVKKSSHK